MITEWDYDWDGKLHLYKKHRKLGTKRIILVRHGEYSVTGEEDTDKRLTDLGKFQAKETALRLLDEGIQFDTILCSTDGLKVPEWAKKMAAANESEKISVGANEVHNPEQWRPDAERSELNAFAQSIHQEVSVPVYNTTSGATGNANAQDKNLNRKFKSKHQIGLLAKEYQRSMVELTMSKGRRFQTKAQTKAKYGW